MKKSSIKEFHLILFLSLLFISIKSNDYDDLEGYQHYGNPEDNNQLSIVSIIYELSYDEDSLVKVRLKTYYDLPYNINFKAFLKTDDELHEHVLECSNEFIDSIVCFTKRNITLDTSKKYFFYYNKKKSGSDITIDGEDVYEDSNRVSLIFKPELDDNIKLFNDNRKFDVKIGNYMVSGGNLYITKKSKKVLHKNKNGFNKNIELNNFIPHCGLAGYMPQSTMVAYKEAIRRGYKMVDGDILFSKDKIPVICHGTNLEAVSNGKGDLTEKTIDELEKLDFGIKFSEKYAGEKILKFEDLLKLCKDNDIIIDLDLYHMKYEKFFKDTDEYIKIIFSLVEKYDMTNSIFFNDGRKEVIEKFKSVKKDVSFSLMGMNQKSSIEKIKDSYQDSKLLIYNMGGLSSGNTITEDAVKYGLSLNKKIKAAKIDELNFAEKVVSWGVNFICTNKLHPFLIHNDKEEPIIAKCTISDTDDSVSECEIDEYINLIDNEIYSVYYSNNIYNISEDIVDEPIGEFKYIDTNLLDELYYKINHFDFKNGNIRLNISNNLKKNEKVHGVVGPTYDNVADCYLYDFTCHENGKHSVECKIKKDDPEKVSYDGNYKIYCLDGYSLNEEEFDNKLNYQQKVKRTKIVILFIVIILVVIFGIVFVMNLKNSDNYRFLKVRENAYISDNSLFR